MRNMCILHIQGEHRVALHRRIPDTNTRGNNHINMYPMQGFQLAAHNLPLIMVKTSNISRYISKDALKENFVIEKENITLSVCQCFQPYVNFNNLLYVNLLHIWYPLYKHLIWTDVEPIDKIYIMMATLENPIM